MARSLPTPIRVFVLLALALLLFAVAFSGATATPAKAAACSDSFELPIEEETGEDSEVAPGDDVIEIQLASRSRGHAVVYAACGDSKPAKKANPNPGFGVFPGTTGVPRRVYDERRSQAGRDAKQLAASRKKRSTSR